MNKVIDNLLSLKLRTFVAEFRAESAALWFLCFYIFIEYIRPHGMYPVLDFLPWGQLSIILTVLSIFVLGYKLNEFGVMDKMFIVISLVVVLSGIFAWSPAASIKYWSTYTSWFLMYFCIVLILNTPNRAFIFIIFFLLINFKLSEHGSRSFAMRGFSFAHWGLTGPPGWFHNSGEFSMQMVVVFSMSWSIILASKKYIENSKRWLLLLMLFPGTAVLSVIGSSSRGGQLALMAIILFLFFKGKNFVRKILFLAVAIYLMLQILPEAQLERFNTMGDDQTSQLRLTHWQNAQQVIKNNPFGIGYYNWEYYYPAHFDVIKYEEIHNTVLQVFVELGYHGGILFLLMIIAAFILNIRTIREMDRIDKAEAVAMAAIARGVNLGLLGTFVSALFMSVLFYPIFWLAFALTSASRHISKRIVDESLDQFDNILLSDSNNATSKHEVGLRNRRYGKNEQHRK